jgi:hypothetical protein
VGEYRIFKLYQYASNCVIFEGIIGHPSCGRVPDCECFALFNSTVATSIVIAFVGRNALARSWTRLASIFSILLIFAPVLHAQTESKNSYAVRIKELSRTEHSVTLEIDFPTPILDTSSGSVYLRALARSYYNGDPLAGVSIPVRASKGSSVTVTATEFASLTLPQNFILRPALRDAVVDGTSKSIIPRISAVPNTRHLLAGTASLKYSGRMRAVNISSLLVGAYDLDQGNHSLRWVSRIVVQITDPAGIEARASATNMAEPFSATASVFRDRQKSAPTKPGTKVLSVDDVQQTPGLRSDDGNVYKMFVNRDGIYHITFEDVKNFGIDPSTVDPRTLRIISQGQQVPVYVFDHQDGHFDPNDYFEFFGEEKTLKYNSKFGDEYYDPYTHNNVYYLVWGTRYSEIPQGGVKRMVEESGEIREADRSKYTNLRFASFRSRLHYERDLFYDKLEISDLNELSTTRDHYFIGQVRTAQSLSVDTITPYPDLTNGRPISLRVALHGISHFDPGAVGAHGEALDTVSNEQQVAISVNGTHLLFGIWDSQEMKFLSSDTLSQRILLSPPSPQILKSQLVGDSARASFPLHVTFDNTLKSSVLYCRFGINWFDLDYDRLYAAYQNQIQFTIPDHTPAALYQFTLDNFTRSDISIYRKGVSKISNIFIDAASPKENGIKAIFQLNVASDADQFFATVDSLKLKPARYLKDDFQDLKKPGNRGAYLIITSRDHLKKFTNETPPLKRLLDQRAQQHGLTGKLIDVANIYDEFNFGARSPVAVRDFLRYAYENWDDPPRYVFLVGTTHEGTEDSVAGAPPEQVPSAYLQSYSFGSTSCDTWLSLLDGDDLLPDLVIGRLPSTDIDHDDAYVNKVTRYEADQDPAGDWKNKALFVSGEALNGNDFYSQVEDLLKRDVPSRIVSNRLGLDQAPRLFYGTDKELIDNINNGISYLHFMGHGGLGVWADPIPNTNRSLFLSSDVSRLHNLGHYPFVASLTCFTGAFDGSTNDALLPGLLLAQNAGAIGAVGTSAFGFRDADDHLAESLLLTMFDTVPATYGDRVTAAKIDYYLGNNPEGNLLAPTLLLTYNFLGDPFVSPFATTERLALNISTRTSSPGATVTVSGTTTIIEGLARIELADAGNNPLTPPHVIDNIPVHGGSFSFNDVSPSAGLPTAGTYRVTIYSSTSTRFARAAIDISYSTTRITELDFEPHPVGPGTSIDFSSAVQAPAGVDSVIAQVVIYQQDQFGKWLQVGGTSRLRMTLASSKYHSTISGGGLTNGMLVSAKSIAYVTGGSPYVSDSLMLVIGASSDPSAFRDNLHHNLVGRFRSTPTGLAWQERIYNWGSVDATGTTAILRDTSAKLTLATVNPAAVPAHGFLDLYMPIVGNTLDSAKLVFLVQPASGTSALNLRDSSTTNDSTYSFPIARGAFAYRKTTGSTIGGVVNEPIDFETGNLTVNLAANAEGQIDADVIRVARLSSLPILQQYAAQQPDIHFVTLNSPIKKSRTAGFRIVSDSLGAIPLTGQIQVSIRIDPTDSITALHPNDLFIYHQDDRSRQWTIIQPTLRNGDVLSATVQNLGNFAVAYKTDLTPPAVDITVEGQVFLNKGDVPDKPHFNVVMQDANGIDITPGKTIVKVDNRVLGATEFAMLDSLRTPTTANLHFEPQLTDGAHAISILSTDNNGNASKEQTLEVNVSHTFLVHTLGSYPNPFSLLMFLAYEIKGIPYAEEVEMNIYTVSGRLIRSMKFPSDDPTQTFGFLKGGTGVPTSLGYHEVWWDGHDDGGADVANGAYFYRLRVKSPGDQKEITGKFARVR